MQVYKSKARWGILFSILLLLILFPSCQPQAKGTIKIGTLFAVTGGASNLGAPEEKTIKMLVEEINAQGGFDGRKIEVVYKDTQSKSENAVALAKQLIEENQVLAILGPTTSGESLAVKDLCNKNNTILISCAAAESIVVPVTPWVFKTPQMDSFAVQKIYQDMQQKGYKNIAILTANSGFGQGGRAQLEKYAAKYGINIVVKEEYSASATDLTDVVTKVKAANVDAIVNWSIEPAQSIVIKNIRQLGLKQQIYQSHGFGNIKYAQAAGAAAEGVIFPCGRIFAIDVLPDSHPQKKVLKEYKNKYEARFNEEVSSFGGHAYDALMILLTAIKLADSTEPEKVREAIERVKNFAGTGGVFNFSSSDHNGLTIEAFEMLTVKDGKFALYNK